MELVYASEALRSQCTNVKAAKKLFHGDLQLSVSLLSRINALEQADVLKDIVVQPAFHFHKLKHKSGRSGRIFCDRCQIQKRSMENPVTAAG